MCLSQILHCGIEQRTPPIFGRAAITLGIGPQLTNFIFPIRHLYYYHSSFYIVSLKVVANFWATVCKTIHPVLLDRCPVLSVCNVGALWPNCWTDQNETWHAGRPRPWPHCVRWGSSSPPPQTAAQQPPHSKFMGAGFACIRII